MTLPDIKLIVGLGNPGDKYQHTRHNIGFAALNDLAETLNAPAWSKSFNGLWTEIKSGPRKIMLFKPMTYMNNSGNPVQSCAAFYKIKPEEILVLHDELDLPLGRLKIKQGGGHGGHNGIKSIEGHLGKDFHRLRIGIDHPGDKDQVSGYVLDNFSSLEKTQIAKIIAAISGNSGQLIAGDFVVFMNNAAIALQL